MDRQKLFGFVVVGAISIALGLWAAKQTIQQQQQRGYPGLGGEFTLQSDQGPVSLSDFRGKTVVIYFGFANCPDICPTTLGMLGAAFRQLTEEERRNTQGIFISVDPDRDSPENLARYAKHFFPDFIGLTGPKESIDDITQRYGVLYMKVETGDSEMGYSVDHNSLVFVINGDGVVESLLRHGDDSQTMLAKIRATLQGKPL